MKVSKEIFVEVYEAYIKTLINQQAQLVIEMSNLQDALDLHFNESCVYHLTYNLDEDTGVYSYKKGKRKRIGF